MLQDPVDINDLDVEQQKEAIKEAYELVRHCDQYSDEHGQHRIIDRHGDWGPSIYCTRSARLLAFYLHGTVRGYYTAEEHRSAYNPEATIGHSADGHDFCVAGNGRFIIDYWAADIEQVDDHPGIIDREEQPDQVHEWYGSEENWHEIDSASSREHILRYAVEPVDLSTKTVPNEA